MSFDIVSNNIVKITGDFPVKEKGFTLTRIDNPDAFTGDYSDYTTIYREIDDSVLFSNDGSIYVEPVPVVKFYTNGGGTLEGETTQEVNNYEELVIPTPVADTDYEFTCWSPEIPTSGEIEGNLSFTAIFTSTLPVPDPEPTIEDRLTAVEEKSQNLSLTVDSIMVDIIPALM